MEKWVREGGERVETATGEGPVSSTEPVGIKKQQSAIGGDDSQQGV